MAALTSCGSSAEASPCAHCLGVRLTPKPLRSCFQELYINYNMAMLDQLADPVYVEAFPDPLSSDEEDNAPAQRCG